MSLGTVLEMEHITNVIRYCCLPEEVFFFYLPEEVWEFLLVTQHHCCGQAYLGIGAIWDISRGDFFFFNFDQIFSDLGHLEEPAQPGHLEGNLKEISAADDFMSGKLIARHLSGLGSDDSKHPLNCVVAAVDVLVD